LRRVRAFLDTNVLVSAFLFKGNENQVLRRGVRGEFKPLCSEYVLGEFERVLRDKLGIPRDQISLWMEVVVEACEIVEALKEHNIEFLDDKDRLVVNAAIDGGAEFLVTGDHHLLKAVFEGLRIVTARKFLEILESSSGK